MKIFPPLLAIALAAAAIAASKPKESLPGTSGRYTSPATYDIDDAPGPDIGTLDTRIRAAKSGRKLKMRISGIVDPSDTPVPIDASLVFDAKRKVRSNSFLLGYYGGIKTSVARYRQKGRTLDFTLKSVPGGSLFFTTLVEGSVKYRCKLGRRSFTLEGAGSLRPLPDGTPIPFLVTMSGKRNK